MAKQAASDDRALDDERWRARQGEKEKKRLEDETRILGPSERYRALNDSMDEYYEVLRPRKFHSRLPDGSVSAERFPSGVRYYEDVLRRDVAGHLRAWDEVRISQLNAELAVQGHSLSLKARAKHDALRRLFGGLRLMTLLAAGMLMVMVFFAQVR